MAYAYSKISRQRLNTCHSRLRQLFESLAEDYNISILCGYRTKAEQDKAVASNASKTQWPNSKHNQMPSMAVDAAFYPVDWDDKGRHYMFIGVVRERARQMGMRVRCGADWDGDFNTDDQTFHDLVHVEYLGEL